MRLSTRNQLTGTITEVTVGTVMAIVKIRLDGGDQVVTSSITKDAVADLGLTVGQAATVFIKSTEVTVGVEQFVPIDPNRRFCLGTNRFRRQAIRPTGERSPAGRQVLGGLLRGDGSGGRVGLDHRGRSLISRALST